MELWVCLKFFINSVNTVKESYFIFQKKRSNCFFNKHNMTVNINLLRYSSFNRTSFNLFIRRISRRPALHTAGSFNHSENVFEEISERASKLIWKIYARGEYIKRGTKDNTKIYTKLGG